MQEERDWLKALQPDAEGPATTVSLYGRVQIRTKKVLASLRARYREQQRTQAAANICAITLEEMERRLRELNEPRDIISLIRSLAKADKDSKKTARMLDEGDVFECPAPEDGEDADGVEMSVKTRSTMLRCVPC